MSLPARPPTAPPLTRIVDDQPAVGEAVADLLASVGLRSRAYPCAAAFLRDDDAAVSGCLVLDVRMPDMSGFDLLATMRAAGNLLPVVFVTGHGDVAMAVRAMKAGAIDFLTKPFDDQQLIDAVNAASRADGVARSRAAEIAAVRSQLNSLTDGERAVLDLAVRGLRNKQIAADLAISEITVKVRRARILRKLEVASSFDLVRLHDRYLNAPG